MVSTAEAAKLYGQQRGATNSMIDDLLAEGDALKADAQGRIAGGSQGYYAGGTPGYYVDNTAAVNQQANLVRDQVANLFAQAIASINAQEPQIQRDAAGRQQTMNKLLVQQSAAASAAGAKQVADQQRAAEAMGLGGVAAPQTARTNDTANALNHNRRDQLGLQGNYFKTMGDFAVGRNRAQAGAFKYSNDEQQKEIEKARQQALANAVYWVPGSRGKYVSTYGSAGKKADRSLISGITKEQKAVTKARNADTKARSSDPSIRQGAIQANRRLY